MSFLKKTWVDRVAESPLRRFLTIIRPDDGSGTFVADIERDEGTVTTEGDAFSAENMNDLETRIKNAFDNVTIDVDSSLSTTSENPVQNKVITTQLNTLESAVANKANKVDLTNISITGSTNNTGATISSGTFFYKDGDLAQAKTSIANGATLTLNTNYELVTAGGLNNLNASLTYVSGTLPEATNLNWTDICTLPSGFTYDNCTIIGYCITDSNSPYVFTHRTDLIVRIEKSTNKIQTIYTQAVGYGSQSITFLIRKYK